MKTHQRLLLPLFAAGTLTLSSCVVPYEPYYASGVGVGVGVGYYETLPNNWNRPYYYYGNRYYYGGQCETGRYNYNGRYYDNRYSHNGRYYYGGRYCEPSHRYYSGSSHSRYDRYRH